MDTIYAHSSGRPPAAIAVIRVSGADAFRVGLILKGGLPPPRTARVRTIAAADGPTVDRAIVLAFPAATSVTGEDVVELHCHGGRAVIDAVERRLAALPGFRAAQAGEFTRRGLINGRIDLAEAEGLADLLAAETELQRRAAIDVAGGRTSRMIREWMDAITSLSARVEALLDFADEDDVAVRGGELEPIRVAAGKLAGAMTAALASPPIDRLRDGISVVVAGPPNAGKSTLVNALADRDVAIVTPIAGTTRDRIEVAVSRNGIPYRLIDTAGLTETDDVVERIGVALSRDALASADIVIWLGDDQPPTGALWVHSRADIAERAILPDGPEMRLSIHEPETIRSLWVAIEERASGLIPLPDLIPLNRRQQDLIRAILPELHSAALVEDVLIVAEHLRRGRSVLATILGIDATDAMLDSLFGRFCIGK